MVKELLPGIFWQHLLAVGAVVFAVVVYMSLQNFTYALS